VLIYGRSAKVVKDGIETAIIVIKVKLSISVKISNCSYLETRFSLTKNTLRK
jgi:hypothetical protein